jgi:glycosyltransferase involved in cell wall biosynthesis
MRILIDGRNIELAQGTGVAAYARQLGAIALDAGHRLEVLGAGPARAAGGVARVRAVIGALRPLRPVRAPALPGLPPRAEGWRIDDLFRTARAKFAAGLGFTEIELPHRVDIAHWTCPLPLRLRGARNLYTIHDLVPLTLSEQAYAGRRDFGRMVAAIARKADRIVTVSESSRREIIATLDVDEARVVNASVAAAWRTTPQEPVERLQALLTALAPGRSLKPESYYLIVGAIEPKKNLRRMIDAHRAAAVAEPLLLVGPAGWACAGDLAALAAAPDAIQLGWRSADETSALICGARAVLFASLSEGFGLPIIEAFQRGAPVVTSNRGACAETAGGAALLVDPTDTVAIRDAIRALSGPGSGLLRAELARLGRIRAADFTLDRVAPRFEAVWRAAIDADPAVDLHADLPRDLR